MSSVAELPRPQWVRWRDTATEWLAVIISCTSVIVSILSMMLVAVCFAIIWSQENRIDKLQSEVETYSNRTIRFETWLKSKGIPLEEIQDD